MKSYFLLLNYKLCTGYTYSLSPSVFFLLSHFYLLSEFYVGQQQEARKEQNQWQATVWSTELPKYERNTSLHIKMGTKYNFANICLKNGNQKLKASYSSNWELKIRDIRYPQQVPNKCSMSWIEINIQNWIFQQHNSCSKAAASFPCCRGENCNWKKICLNFLYQEGWDKWNEIMLKALMIYGLLT